MVQRRIPDGHREMNRISEAAESIETIGIIPAADRTFNLPRRRPKSAI